VRSLPSLHPPSAAVARSRPVAHLVAAGRDQAIVAGGQVLAGIGNLVFVALAARVLRPGAFGSLAAFVALLTAVHLPSAGLAAASALTPAGLAPLARRAAITGAVASVMVVVLASPLSAVTGLPVAMVLALAAALPAAPLLGLQRGIAYGTGRHGALVRSLLAEPAARLTIGLALATVAGASGAAWGAAAGGWCALVVLRRAEGAAAVGPEPVASREPASTAATGRTGAAATGVGFVALTVLQHQDVVVANRLLGPADAGSFAALSTIGGLVAFATATLPLVLLGRSGPDAHADPADGGDREAWQVAVGAAVGATAAAVLLAVLAAPSLVLAVVGTRYSSVSPLVAPYLAAMGALGVARVLAARRCAAGHGRRVARLGIVAVVLQALALAALARTAGQVVAVSACTLGATAVALAAPWGWRQAVVPALPRPAPPVFAHLLARLWRRPDARLLAGLTVLAVVLRLATERSFWVDEAISVRQVQLPLGAMLDDLRTTDVHPPLHFIVLWGVVRLLGTAEWAVRLPSVLFGAALVPCLYGLCRELFDRRTAQVAAVLAVPAPFLVWYSQEARMYALFMLLGVGGVWAQVAALRGGSRRAFAAWSVASAALLWTQWFAVLPLAVQHVATAAHLVRRRREGRVAWVLVRRWLGSVALLLALVAPLAPYLHDQLAAYGERGAGLSMPAAAGADSSQVATGLSSYAVIANLLWALGGYHSDGVMVRLGALWPLALLGCLALLGRRLQWVTRLVLAVAVVPGAALFVIAHSKRDLFELRYFVLAAPLLLALVARAVTTGAHGRRALGVLTAGLVALSTAALVDQQVNGTNPRLYDFKGAVAEIEETARPGDGLAYAPAYLDGVLAYYAPEMPGAPLGSVQPDDVDGQIYVVVAERFLTEASAGRIGDALARLEEARGAPERFERPNVIVWRFR